MTATYDHNPQGRYGTAGKRFAGCLALAVFFGLFCSFDSGSHENQIPLDAGIWAHGSISEDGEMWYSFEVNEGGEYRVWWNDADGTMNGDVRVFAFYSDGAAIFGERRGVDSGWDRPQSFTASKTGSVQLRVVSYSGGPFAIAYMPGTDSRPAFTFEINEEDAVALAAGLWTEGTMSGSQIWYSFGVTAGSPYRIWWNDADGTLDADITAAAFYGDGDPIFGENGDADSGWDSPRWFMADRTGTVFVRVSPYHSGTRGSFAVAYGTANSRPPFAFKVPDDATPLTEDSWKEDSTTGRRETWFSFGCEAGSEYRVWWNDVDGNGNYYGDVLVSAFYGDGTEIFGGRSGVDAGWSRPQRFTADRTGTVLIKAVPYYSDDGGSFAVAYGSGSTKPSFDFGVPEDTAPLAAGSWAHGMISSGQASWYSFEVEAGSDYYIWWNDVDGNGAFDGDVRVTAFYENGDEIFSGADSGWDYSRDFRSDRTGRVILMVRPYSERSGGDFAIAYGITPERPVLMIGPGQDTAVLPISLGSWIGGNISGNIEMWYSFDVEEGSGYYVWWDDFDGNLDADVKVSAFYQDGADIWIGADIGWDSPEWFEARKSGTVFLRVVRHPGDTSGGSFAITFNTSGVRPPSPPPGRNVNLRDSGSTVIAPVAELKT